MKLIKNPLSKREIEDLAKEDKIIDTMAVLNLRPSQNNDSLEILDSLKREKFIEVIKTVFAELWS